MATSTTVAAVQSAFVTAASAVVPSGTTVHRMWPGPDATRDMVFFTDTDWQSVDDAVIKAGRRYRNETYQANFEVWTFHAGSPSEAGEAIDDALAIYNACEGVIAEASSTVRAVDGVINATCELARMEPVAFERGWAVVIQARLNVSARLV